MDCKLILFRCEKCNHLYYIPENLAQNSIKCGFCLHTQKRDVNSIVNDNDTNIVSVSCHRCGHIATIPSHEKEVTILCEKCHKVYSVILPILTPDNTSSASKEISKPIPKKAIIANAVPQPIQYDIIPRLISYIFLALVWLIVFFGIRGCVSFLLSDPSENNTYSSKHILIGNNYKTSMQCYGAISADELDRASSMLNDHDAFLSMLVTGRVINIPENTRVAVEDVTLTGKAKVRIWGEAGSVWIYSVWLE